MKKILILFLLLICFNSELISQTSTDKISKPPSVVSKSPTVSSITEANLSSVELSSGKYPYTVPIYNINTEELAIDISINNSGNPLKVNELSGPLGIGWNLSVNNFITVNKNFGPGYNTINNDERYSPAEIDEIFKSNDNQFLNINYNYSFNGNSGNFYIKNNSVTHIGNQNYKILINNSGETIYGFTIIDDDGVKYVFGPETQSEFNDNMYCEKSRKLYGPYYLDVPAISFTDIDGNIGNSIHEPNLTYTTKSEWYYNQDISQEISTLYLKKIIQPITNNIIEFEYTPNLGNFLGGHSLLINEEYNYIPQSSDNTLNEKFFHRSFQINETTNIFLTKIKWVDGEVEFNYTASKEGYRIDHSSIVLPGKIEFFDTESLVLLNDTSLNYGSKLSNIKIKNKNLNIVKSFDLHYTYNEANTSDKKRLMLKRIEEINNNDTLDLYEFEYLTYGGNFPSLLTNDVDYWGYYNYQEINSIVRNHKIPILQKMCASNGWSVYNNDTDLKNLILNSCGIMLDYMTAPSVFTLPHLNFDYDNYFSNNQYGITEYNRSSNEWMKIGMLSKIILPTKGEINLFYTLDTLKYYYNNSFRSIIGPGLKVNKIIIEPYDNQPDIIKNYYYSNGQLLNPPQFARTYYKPIANYYAPIDALYGNKLNQSNYTISFEKVIETIADGGKTIYEFTTPYDEFSDGRTLYGILSTQFSSQDVSFTPESSTLGTYFQYYNNIDFYPYVNLIDYSWAFNKLKSSKIYNQNSELLEETINSYQPVMTLFKPFYAIALLNDVVKNRSIESTTSYNDDGIYKLVLSYNTNGWMKSISKLNKKYKPGSNDLISVNEVYVYDNSTRYLKSVEKIYNEVNKEKTTYVYINDVKDIYQSQTDENIIAICSMRDSNILKKPLQTNNYIYINSQYRLSHSTLDFYKIFNNNQPNLWKQYLLNTSSPISNFTELQLNSNWDDLVYDNRYKLLRTFLSYNSESKIKLLNDHIKGDVSYLWNNNLNQPIAELINAKYSNFSSDGNSSYCSFEFGDLLVNENNDYWLNENCQIKDESKTGLYSLKLNNSSNTSFHKNFTIEQGINNLLVSGWCKIENTSVSNEPQTKTLELNTIFSDVSSNSPVVNNNYTFNLLDNGQWHYFSFKIPINSTLPLTIKFKNSIANNGNILLDDIRVQPENSLMTTYTYDPITSLQTSISDHNNRPTYYNYDAHGRLIDIKDQNKNFAKTYIYLNK